MSNYEAAINRVLVVLGPGHLNERNLPDSAVLRRSAALAESFDAEIRVYVLSDTRRAGSEAAMAAAGYASDGCCLPAQGDAYQLAALANYFRCQCATVTHEFVAESEQTEAILAQIKRTKADIVMKQAGRCGLIPGVGQQTDSELARKSPADFWLVDEQVSRVDRIVAAVGSCAEEVTDVTTSFDYEVLNTAGVLSEAFAAEIYPVNAFDAPEPICSVGSLPQVSVPDGSKMMQLRTRQRLQRKGFLKALARLFNIARSNVRVREGRPHAVISGLAREINADMIVLGAQSNSRHPDHLKTPTTLDPVMSGAEADVFVVRGKNGWPVRDLVAQILPPRPGIPASAVLRKLATGSVSRAA